MNLFYDPGKRRLRAPGIFLGLFGVLFALNFCQLGNPPYWDELVGLHNQALYLAKHNFDILSLFSKEQGYLYGGSGIYRLELTPWIYSLFYLLPPVLAHLCGHLFTLACLAGTGTLLYLLARDVCAESLCVLWVAAALSDPILAGRAAAMDHDTVLAFAVAVALYAFLRRCDKTAFALSTLCFLVKFTGVLVPLALGAYSLYAACAEHRARKLAWSGAYFGLAALAFLLHTLPSVMFGEANENPALFSFSWREVGYHLYYYYPYFTGCVLAVAAVFAYRFLTEPEFRSEDRRLLAAAIFIGGYIAAYFLAPMPKLPRYTCIAVMPLALLGAYSIRPCREKLLQLALLAVLAVNVLNWHGLLLPEFKKRTEQTMNYYERSREYLTRVDMDQRLCGELAMAYDRLIVAKWPYVQMLGVPEFRYVSVALPHLRVIGNDVRYAPTARQFNPDEVDRETLFLYSVRGFEFWHRPRLAPPPGATLHYIENPASPLDGALVYSNVILKHKGR